MKFSDILGHSEIKSALVAMAERDRLPHALMLAGPRGVGKLNLARAFAQYLHCMSPRNGDSCGECPACRQHSALNFPDMHYVYPIVKRGGKNISNDYAEEWRNFIINNEYPSIKSWAEAIEAGNTSPIIYVNESEEIIRVANLSNYSADKKVFIIWLPEKMHTATANKLLKILEEPFENTLFLMVSEEPSGMLPTILSRAQRLDVRRLGDDVIADYLMKKRTVSEETARETASLANGSPGFALEILESSTESDRFREMFRRMMRMAYSCNGSELKKISDEIAGLGRQTSIRFMEYSLGQIRENFITNLGIPELNSQTSDERAFSTKFAPFIHERNIEALEKEFSRASNDISRNANAKIVCFDLMLKLMMLLRTPGT